MDFSIGSSAFWQSPESSMLIEQDDRKRHGLSPEQVHEEISVQPTVFPTPCAKQHSDIARRKILAGIDNKDQYRIAPMLTRNQAIKLLNKIREGLDVGFKHVEMRLTIDNLLKSLRCTPAGQVDPMKEWAKISLALEDTLKILGGYNDQQLRGVPHLAYLKRCIEKLEFVARYTWMQAAYEKTVNAFTTQIVNCLKTDPNLTTSASLKGTAEISTPLVDVVSIGGSLGYQTIQRVDDEGYLITEKLGSFEVSGNFKIPYAMKLKAQAGITAGYYSYTRRANHHAMCYFTELLADNGSNPGIAAFLSRRATMGEKHTKENTENLADFYAVQKEYLLLEKSIATELSLLMGMDFSNNPTAAQYDDDGHVIVFDAEVQPTAVAQTEQLSKKAVVIHGTSRTTTFTGAATAGLDLTFYQLNGTLAGDKVSKVSCAKRYMSLCDLVRNSYSSPQYTAKLIQDLNQQATAIRKKVHGFWYAAGGNFWSKTGDQSHPHALSNMSVEDEVRQIEQRYEQAFQSEVRRRYGVDHRTCMEHPELFPADELIALATEFENACSQKVIACRGRDIDYHAAHPELYLEKDIARIEQDFAAYTDLHAKQVMGLPGADAAIADFHKIYGASCTEACLQKLAVLTAAYYSQIRDKDSALAQQVYKLETAIHATGIPHDPVKFRKLASAQQEYYIKTEDKNVRFSLKNGFNYSLGFAEMANGGFEANSRELLHFNPTRSGSYRNFKITLTRNQGCNQQILTALAKYCQGEGLTEMANYFAIENLASVYTEGSYIFRHFKPADSDDLPRVMLFRRSLWTSGFEISPKLPIPIPLGPVSLKLGFTFACSVSKMLQDYPTSDSLFYFMVHYLHGVFTTTIRYDKFALTEVDSPDNQESYWHTLEKNHQATFKQILLNIALGNAHRLSQELEHIKQRYLKYLKTPGYETDQAKMAQIAAVDTAVANLVACATAYRDDPSDGRYAAGMAGFKKFMLTLYSHWMFTREKSEAYEPWKYEFAPAPPVKKRAHVHTRSARYARYAGVAAAAA